MRSIFQIIGLIQWLLTILSVITVIQVHSFGISGTVYDPNNLIVQIVGCQQYERENNCQIDLRGAVTLQPLQQCDTCKIDIYKNITISGADVEDNFILGKNALKSWLVLHEHVTLTLSKLYVSFPPEEQETSNGAKNTTAREYLDSLFASHLYSGGRMTVVNSYIQLQCDTMGMQEINDLLTEQYVSDHELLFAAHGNFYYININELVFEPHDLHSHNTKLDDDDDGYEDDDDGGYDDDDTDAAGGRGVVQANGVSEGVGARGSSTRNLLGGRGRGILLGGQGRGNLLGPRGRGLAERGWFWGARRSLTLHQLPEQLSLINITLICKGVKAPVTERVTLAGSTGDVEQSLVEQLEEPPKMADGLDLTLPQGTFDITPPAKPPTATSPYPPLPTTFSTLTPSSKVTLNMQYTGTTPKTDDWDTSPLPRLTFSNIWLRYPPYPSNRTPQCAPLLPPVFKPQTPRPNPDDSPPPFDTTEVCAYTLLGGQLTLPSCSLIERLHGQQLDSAKGGGGVRLFESDQGGECGDPPGGSRQFVSNRAMEVEKGRGGTTLSMYVDVLFDPPWCIVRSALHCTLTTDADSRGGFPWYGWALISSFVLLLVVFIMSALRHQARERVRVLQYKEETPSDSRARTYFTYSQRGTCCESFWRALACAWGEDRGGGSSGGSKVALSGMGKNRVLDDDELSKMGGEVGVTASTVGAPRSVVAGSTSTFLERPDGRDAMLRRIQEIQGDIQRSRLVMQEQIGRGAYGVVYKGMLNKQAVAVKVVHFEGSSEEQKRQSALIEAAVTTSLKHPHLVHSYSYSINKLVPCPRGDGGRGPPPPITTHGEHAAYKLHLVQEYCDMGALTQAIRQRLFARPTGEIDFILIATVALHIAKGMLCLHDNNIIHGDLKPNNILLKRSRSSRYGFLTKIADFGLSVRLPESRQHLSGIYAGTPYYAAPEIAQFGHLSKKADVFSFAVILWELYNQQLVYVMDGEGEGGGGGFKSNASFPTFQVTCPLAFALLCAACLSPEPADRPDFGFIVRVCGGLRTQAIRGVCVPGVHNVHVSRMFNKQMCALHSEQVCTLVGELSQYNGHDRGEVGLIVERVLHKELALPLAPAAPVVAASDYERQQREQRRGGGDLIAGGESGGEGGERAPLDSAQLVAMIMGMEWQGGGGEGSVDTGSANGAGWGGSGWGEGSDVESDGRAMAGSDGGGGTVLSGGTGGGRAGGGGGVVPRMNTPNLAEQITWQSSEQMAQYNEVIESMEQSVRGGGGGGDTFHSVRQTLGGSGGGGGGSSSGNQLDQWDKLSVMPLFKGEDG